MLSQHGGVSNEAYHGAINLLSHRTRKNEGFFASSRHSSGRDYGHS